MSIRICNYDFADVAGLRYTAYYVKTDEIKSVFKKRIIIHITKSLVMRKILLEAAKILLCFLKCTS